MGETILIVSKFGRICHGKLRKKPKLFSPPNQLKSQTHAMLQAKRLGCHGLIEIVSHGIITSRTDPRRTPRDSIVIP